MNDSAQQPEPNGLLQDAPVSGPGSCDIRRPYLATVDFLLGALPAGTGVGAYNAFWGSPEAYLRGWSGLAAHMFVVGIIAGIPTLGFLLSVKLTGKIAEEHTERLYALSACCGFLYGVCLLPCFLMIFFGTEFPGIPAGLLWGVWLLSPFLVGHIALWAACRSGMLRPEDNKLR